MTTVVDTFCQFDFMYQETAESLKKNYTPNCFSKISIKPLCMYVMVLFLVLPLGSRAWLENRYSGCEY